MASLFKKNAYQLLGIDVSSAQKDIVKRGKEILNYLLIDEQPSYPLDLAIYTDKRTSNNVKQALEDLSRPEKKIKEHFFWFEIRNNTDEEAIGFINKDEYNEAIELWKSETEKNGVKSYFGKKNLAILFSILVDVKNEKNYLQKSLFYWHELITDEAFWSTFFKSYKLFDDLNTREDILTSFKDNSSKYLADFYLEVSKKYEDKSIFENFYNKFHVKGSKVDDVYLKNIYLKLTEICEFLRKIAKNENKKMPLESFPEIEANISSIKSYLKEINDLGLYESSDVKVERDNIAEAILSLSIFLHNEHNLSEEALILANDANKICGTDSMKEKIKKDIRTIEETIEFKEHEVQYNLIFSTVREGDFNQALNLLNLELQKEEIPLSIRDTYLKMKTDLETRLKTHGKPLKTAPSLQTINGCGQKIYGDTLWFVFMFIPIFAIRRYSVIDLGNGQYNFLGEFKLHQWQKVFNIVAGVIIAILAIGIIRSSNSNSASSTSTENSSSSVENVCSDSSCSQKWINTKFSYKDSSDKCICDCIDGFIWNDDESGCEVPNYTKLCQKQFGPNSTWTGEFEGEEFICN